MNEVFANVTLVSLLPPFFFERVFVGAIGCGMFAHFICMASAAPTNSPWIVMAFLMTIVGSAVCMFATAISGEIQPMVMSLIIGLGSMLLFWLWLWYQGLHVKDFLEKKYGTP